MVIARIVVRHVSCPVTNSVRAAHSSRKKDAASGGKNCRTTAKCSCDGFTPWCPGQIMALKQSETGEPQWLSDRVKAIGFDAGRLGCPSALDLLHTFSNLIVNQNNQRKESYGILQHLRLSAPRLSGDPHEHAVRCHSRLRPAASSGRRPNTDEAALQARTSDGYDPDCSCPVSSGCADEISASEDSNLPECDLPIWYPQNTAKVPQVHQEQRCLPARGAQG